MSRDLKNIGKVLGYLCLMIYYSILWIYELVTFKKYRDKKKENSYRPPSTDELNARVHTVRCNSRDEDELIRRFKEMGIDIDE